MKDEAISRTDVLRILGDEISGAIEDYKYDVPMTRAIEAIRALPVLDAPVAGDEAEFERALSKLTSTVADAGMSDDPDNWHEPIEAARSLVLSLHRARQGTVPLKGEREIAEAIQEAWGDIAASDAIDKEIEGNDAWANCSTASIHATRTVIERGIAHSPEQVERMAQAIHDTWDRGVLNSIDGCRGIVADILAATGAKS